MALMIGMLNMVFGLVAVALVIATNYALVIVNLASARAIV